jgi:hypothetical protein
MASDSPYSSLAPHHNDFDNNTQFFTLLYPSDAQVQLQIPNPSHHGSPFAIPWNQYQFQHAPQWITGYAALASSWQSLEVNAATTASFSAWLPNQDDVEFTPHSLGPNLASCQVQLPTVQPLNLYYDGLHRSVSHPSFGPDEFVCTSMHMPAVAVASSMLRKDSNASTDFPFWTTNSGPEQFNSVAVHSTLSPEIALWQAEATGQPLSPLVETIDSSIRICEHSSTSPSPSPIHGDNLSSPANTPPQPKRRKTRSLSPCQVCILILSRHGTDLV